MENLDQYLIIMLKYFFMIIKFFYYCLSVLEIFIIITNYLSIFLEKESFHYFQFIFVENLLNCHCNSNSYIY